MGGHPVVVVPVAPDHPNDRGVLGRVLAAEPDRIGLQRQDLTARSADLIFVGRSLPETGDEDLPHPRRATLAHGMAAAVPDVEVANNRDPLGIRGPDGKMRAIGAFMRDDMRAQHLPQAAVRALAKQVFVHFTQNGP